MFGRGQHPSGCFGDIRRHSSYLVRLCATVLNPVTIGKTACRTRGLNVRRCRLRIMSTEMHHAWIGPVRVPLRHLRRSSPPPPPAAGLFFTWPSSSIRPFPAPILPAVIFVNMGTYHSFHPTSDNASFCVLLSCAAPRVFRGGFVSGRDPARALDAHWWHPRPGDLFGAVRVGALPGAGGQLLHGSLLRGQLRAAVHGSCTSEANPS